MTEAQSYNYRWHYLRSIHEDAVAQGHYFIWKVPGLAPLVTPAMWKAEAAVISRDWSGVGVYDACWIPLWWGAVALALILLLPQKPLTKPKTVRK